MRYKKIFRIFEINVSTLIGLNEHAKMQKKLVATFKKYILYNYVVQN